MRKMKMSMDRFQTLLMRQFQLHRIPIGLCAEISAFDSVGVWQNHEDAIEQDGWIEQVSYGWEDEGIYFYRSSDSGNCYGIYFHGWEKGWTVYYTITEKNRYKKPYPKIRKFLAKDYTELRKGMKDLDRGSYREILYGDASKFHQVFILSLAICIGFTHVGYAADLLIQIIRRGGIHSPMGYSIIQSIAVGAILVVIGFYYLQISCRIMKENFSRKGKSKEEYLQARCRKKQQVGTTLLVFTMGYCILTSILHWNEIRWKFIAMRPFQSVIIPICIATIALVLLYQSSVQNIPKKPK